MQKVRFFYDFQGVETNNVFYPAGVHEVPEGVADRVVKDGRAELVKEFAPVVAPVVAPEPVAEVAPMVDEPIMTSDKKRGRK